LTIVGYQTIFDIMKTDHLVSLIADIKNKCDKYLINELKRCGIKDLAPSHGGILNALYHRGQMSMKELSSAIDRDKSTVTSLINKLIEIGYIKKTQDTGDKRVYYISLTAKGKKLQPVFDEISRNISSKFIKDLNIDEQESLVRILEKIKTTW
jgi:MarR family transcriptional regulator, organic hydroperoxide resistance regulator